MKRKVLPRYLVEMAGVYWTASRLCSEGLIPSIPPRNLPRFDLPVTSLDGRVHATVQVKTRSTRQGWIIAWHHRGRKLRLHGRPNHFYVLVDMASAKTTRAMVIPCSVVNAHCRSQARRWGEKPTGGGKRRGPFPVSVNPERPGWEKYWERWDRIREVGLAAKKA